MEEWVGQPCSCKGEGTRVRAQGYFPAQQQLLPHISWILKEEWEQISSLSWVLLEPYFHGKDKVGSLLL